MNINVCMREMLSTDRNFILDSWIKGNWDKNRDDYDWISDDDYTVYHTLFRKHVGKLLKTSDVRVVTPKKRTDNIYGYAIISKKKVVWLYVKHLYRHFKAIEELLREGTDE